MKQHLIFSCLFLLTASVAKADGVPLKNGRYDGEAIVFDLTNEQKAVIDRFRTCHLEQFKTMNQYTPYVFTLTPTQSQALKARIGIAPRYFDAYETYIGFNDAGPHWNLVLRFNENQIEVPLDLVVSDKDAKKAHSVQGWKPTNPCFPRLGKVTSNTLLDTGAMRRSA